MILNRFLTVLIFTTILSKQVETQAQYIQSDKQIRSRWNKTLSYITFQQTLIEFPQIRDNINAIRIAELIDAGGCKNDLQPLRILFIDSKIYFYGVFGNYQARVQSLKKFYTHIATKANIPDMYFVIHFQDELLPQTVQVNYHETCRKLPLFMFNKNFSAEFEKTKFLLPDSQIINENWEQEIEIIKQSSQKINWQNKKQKLLFRGLASGPHSYDMRIDQDMDFFKYFHRGAFLLLALKYPNLIDAEYSRHTTVFFNETQRRFGDKPLVLAKEISYQQQLKYKYILSADGFGAAWKRVPFVLFSNSILFKPYSQKIQWFYDKLIPNTNFVQIKDDLSNLFSRMDQINKNTQKAKSIIQQANKLANKYLTRQQVTSFTIETLLKYAYFQKLSLNQQEKEKIRNGVDIQQVLLEKSMKEKALAGIIFFTIFIIMFGILLFILFFHKISLGSLSLEKNKEIQEFSFKEISLND